MSSMKTDLNKLTNVLIARIEQHSSERPTFKTVIGDKDNFGGMMWNRSELVYLTGLLKPDEVVAALKGLRVVKKLGRTKRNPFRTHEGQYIFSPDRKTDKDGVRIVVWRANNGDVQFVLSPILVPDTPPKPKQKSKAELDAIATALAEAEVEAAFATKTKTKIKKVKA